MATVQISGLPELLAAVGDDWLEIEEAATGLSYRIKKANLIGAILTGGGTIATGGHTITVPASGTAALKSGAPVAGNLASWLDANQVQDAGVAAANVPLLDAAQTFTAAQTFSAGVVASSFLTGLVVLSPDTATTITPLKTSVCLLIYPLASASGQHYALVALRTDLGTVQAELLVGDSTEVTTGVLTGTTGQVGYFTISPHSDGKIYLENRRGIGLTWHYVLFG